MCCNHKNGMWFFLTFAAVFLGVTYFNYFIDSFVHTLTNPNTWLLVALVIAGSLIYRWSSRDEKTRQFQ